RLAHDAADRRGRARRRRLRALPLAARRDGRRPAARAAHGAGLRTRAGGRLPRAPGALALLHGVLRRPVRVARAGAGRELSVVARAGGGARRVSDRLDRRGTWILLAVLGALVAVDVPQLGSEPWPFRPP